MKKQMVALITEVQIIFLILVTLLGMVLVMPSLAAEGVANYPEIAWLKTPMLLLSEGLLGLFIAGLVIVISLLRMYRKEQVFIPQFPARIVWLILLCGLAEVGIVVLFVTFSSVGGPGPGLALLFIFMFVVIAVLASVFWLIVRIIREGIRYKQMNDLTI